MDEPKKENVPLKMVNELMYNIEAKFTGQKMSWKLKADFLKEELPKKKHLMLDVVSIYKNDN